MHIEYLRIAEGDLGLKASTLERLGRVVVLAGPNGGGKTRVLQMVRTACAKWLPDDQLSELDKRVRKLTNMLEKARSLQELGTLGDLEPNAETIRSELDATRRTVETARSVRFTEPPMKAAAVVGYSFRETNLEDWRDRSFHSMQSSLSMCWGGLRTDNLHKDVLAAIVAVAHRYFILKGLRDQLSSEAEHYEHFEKLFLKLSEWIEKMLGEAPAWDPRDASPKLFGQRVDNGTMSEGQRVLLMVAFSMAVQDGSDKDLILLMDEPELHLHPKALTDVIDRVIDKCPKAQIWIATHSVHLIARFGERDAWSVIDGAVRRAGSNWHQMLETLVGSPDQIEQLRMLLGLPAYAAMMQFAAACLTPPGIVNLPPGDPQTTQIASALAGTPTPDRRTRVIDYGAGKGRLLRELCSGVRTVADTYDYFAIDVPSTSSDVSDMCRECISEAYPNDSRNRYFLGALAAQNELEEASFDWIVACNVLHEIDPVRWLEVFGPQGEVDRLLAPTGQLMIVEDQQLATGENAHQFNFLVLDRRELQALFNDKVEGGEIQTLKHEDPKYAERLKVHKVPKTLLARVTPESRRKSIEMLRGTAMEQAQALQHHSDAKSGRLYGFWVMQHFNASAALKRI